MIDEIVFALPKEKKFVNQVDEKHVSDETGERAENSFADTVIDTIIDYVPVPFNDLTTPPLQCTRRPHLWGRFIEFMIEGYSLRKCSEELHGEVTHVTLFYWRHKILAALKQIPTEAFPGIVEMDETYFLYSEKGKRNISERKPPKRGRIRTKKLDEAIGGHLSDSNVLCTDVWRVFQFLRDGSLPF